MRCPRRLDAPSVHAAAYFGNTTPDANPQAQYVIASAPGTHPDGFNRPTGNFCAWHWDTGSISGLTSPYGDIAFTNLPYVPDLGKSCGANVLNEGAAGVLDGVTLVEGHEYAETLTDQIVGGGWVDGNGEESGDKCAWVTTGPGRAENLTFATGTFPMQSIWSNEDNGCVIGHSIWRMPGLPDDFAMDALPRAGFVTPGGAIDTTLETATVSGNPQPIDLTVSGLPPDATASLSSSSITTDDSQQLTITTASTTPYGTYPITITGTGSTIHTATYTLSVAAPPVVLENGVAVTNLSGDADSDLLWQFDSGTGMPPFFSTTDFTMNAATGDVDLNVREDAIPTATDYDCLAARGSKSLGICAWNGVDPAPQRWYIRVHGVTAYSGLGLQATFAPKVQQVDPAIPLVQNGGSAGQEHFYIVDVPLNTTKLTVHVGGGRTDLYVRRAGLPGPVAYDCVPPKLGHRGEKCTVYNPAPAAGRSASTISATTRRSSCGRSSGTDAGGILRVTRRRHRGHRRGGGARASACRAPPAHPAGAAPSSSVRSC